jgi:cell division septal protein FtsQ
VLVRRAKIAVLGLAALLFVAFGSIYAAKACSYARHAITLPSWAKWRLTTVNCAGVPKDHLAQVSRIITIKPGTEVTSAQTLALSKTIAMRFPALSDVQVRRNWISKQLMVSARRRSPLAYVVMPGCPDSYVDETGELYSVEPSSSSMNLVALNAPNGLVSARLRQDTVSALRVLRDSVGDFPSRPETIAVDRGETALSLKLADGTLIDWGAMNFTAEKIARLSQVYNSSRARMPGPYRINMRYFEDGRILLNRIEPGL